VEIEHVRVVENNQEADKLCAGVFLSESACMYVIAVRSAFLYLLRVPGFVSQ
jgi:hypothetical protein